jgi:hypothetical protein
LKRRGELHLKLSFSSTSLAVEADKYLKKLDRSWRRFGEHGMIARKRKRRLFGSRGNHQGDGMIGVHVAVTALWRCDIA